MHQVNYKTPPTKPWVGGSEVKQSRDQSVVMSKWTQIFGEEAKGMEIVIFVQVTLVF